jgi:leader peptidase (prepilin peptidase)/N-methyltransferase
MGPVFFYIVAGVFGLLIGSFLNVCILSWGKEPKESVLRPRSRCPKCGKQIAWYDNIPVLSWLILRGKCRHCKQSISTMYPLVELATGIIWVYFVWLFGPSLAAVRAAVFFTLLLGILVSDARAYIIPDEFTLGGLALGLILTAIGGFFLSGTAGAWHGLGFSLIGGAVGFAILGLVGWLGGIIMKQDAMGGGDIKMMAMVGVFVGWTGVLLTIFLGALIGTVVFLPLALIGRKKLVPFGIFLALGAGVAYLFGAKLVQWYSVTYLGA